MNIEVGKSREGEHPAWRLLRLWPLVAVFMTFIAGYVALQSTVAVLAEQQKETKESAKQHDQQISALREQSIRVDERLRRVDEKLEEQRRTTDETRGDVKRVLDLLQTPGRR
jgi:hypothetical protein